MAFEYYLDTDYEFNTEFQEKLAEILSAEYTATSTTGTDISSWVDYDDIDDVSFTLASAVSYRTNGASKAVPGFDVIDYGQEDYVFGDTEQDARHWDIFVLTAFEENYSELEALFDGEVINYCFIEKKE